MSGLCKTTSDRYYFLRDLAPGSLRAVLSPFRSCAVTVASERATSRICNHYDLSGAVSLPAVTQDSLFKDTLHLSVEVMT